MSKYIFNNDTDILEFLEQLRENGIQIWGEGEKIRYRSKNRQLAPETLRILKMAKGQILDFFRMIEKNVIPLTSIQTAYVVGQTAGCELGNINAHYYIEYTIESLDVERLEQMINLVISKNDALRLIVTHEGKASFLDNVPYYSVPVYSLYDGNDREQKRLERSHHRYNYYKWPMFHFCVGKTSGKTSVLHVDFDCIILDAWSAKLLLNEIFSLYYGKDVKFPRISFMNYMRLKTDKGDLEAEEYWKEKVKNMPSFPKLNYQKKFAEVQNVRFDRIECDFSFIETQRLYQKIKNYHFTPAAVISTIFMKTLAQYSETPGLSINVTLFNRQLLHEDVNIFSVLGVGGTLVLPNPEKGPDASHWGRLLNEYKVTLWNSVPAQAEMLDAFASKSESYPTVRLVLLSGDWINTSLPGRLRKIMTNAQMISLGGATEGGIWSIYHEIDEIEERPTILYGKALLGQWMGVVDEELRICPEYVSGQIAIGGYSLAEGYLGDTTLTKEKFVYVEEEKNRIYLTGDNGRYVENGDIEFLGRLDNQVKINGHRIEIAEIENAIRGMQNIEDCCVVYNQSIGKGVLIAFIKNKISSISYTKEEYRKQLAFFLPPAMIPSEFVNVERFPLSTNGKIDRKGLAESIQKNIKVKHNAKATLISQKKEYVELAKSIKKIVCSISGNDYIDYEDNLLENGLDSLLLSQISGRIVSDIQEAQGMRFDEILRASLTMPTIMGIAQYISDCKNPSKNQMHSNAGNQTRNSYTVVYIFGDNENEIRDVLIEKLSASNISCKRVGGQEIIERCHEDISVKKKYIIAFSEMASLCITKASELLGENIIINRIFLINPSKAKESDLYLGDISIIDGNSVAIKSWEKAVLGNVREFESNSNDIFDIIMRELENDK